MLRLAKHFRVADSHFKTVLVKEKVNFKFKNRIKPRYNDQNFNIEAHTPYKRYHIPEMPKVQRTAIVRQFEMPDNTNKFISLTIPVPAEKCSYRYDLKVPTLATPYDLQVLVGNLITKYGLLQHRWNDSLHIKSETSKNISLESQGLHKYTIHTNSYKRDDDAQTYQKSRTPKHAHGNHHTKPLEQLCLVGIDPKSFCFSAYLVDLSTDETKTVSFPITDFIRNSPTILFKRAIDILLRIWPLDLVTKKTGLIFPIVYNSERRKPYLNYLKFDVNDKYLYDFVKTLDKNPEIPKLMKKSGPIELVCKNDLFQFRTEQLYTSDLAPKTVKKTHFGEDVYTYELIEKFHRSGVNALPLENYVIPIQDEISDNSKYDERNDQKKFRRKPYLNFFRQGWADSKLKNTFFVDLRLSIKKATWVMSFKEMGSVKEQYLLGPVPISTHLAYPMEFKFKRNDASILLALAPKILEINLHHFLTREGQHPNGTKILLSVNLMENALAATNFGHQLMNKLSYEQFSDAMEDYIKSEFKTSGNNSIYEKVSIKMEPGWTDMNGFKNRCMNTYYDGRAWDPKNNKYVPSKFLDHVDNSTYPMVDVLMRATENRSTINHRFQKITRTQPNMISQSATYHKDDPRSSVSSHYYATSLFFKTIEKKVLWVNVKITDFTAVFYDPTKNSFQAWNQPNTVEEMLTFSFNNQFTSLKFTEVYQKCYQKFGLKNDENLIVYAASHPTPKIFSNYQFKKDYTGMTKEKTNGETEFLTSDHTRNPATTISFQNTDKLNTEFTEVDKNLIVIKYSRPRDNVPFSTVRWCLLIFKARGDFKGQMMFVTEIGMKQALEDYKKSSLKVMVEMSDAKNKQNDENFENHVENAKKYSKSEQSKIMIEMQQKVKNSIKMMDSTDIVGEIFNQIHNVGDHKKSLLRECNQEHENELSAVASYIIKKYDIRTLINLNDLYKDNSVRHEPDSDVTSTNVFQWSDSTDNEMFNKYKKLDEIKKRRYIDLPNEDRSPSYVNLTSSGSTDTHGKNKFNF